MIVESFYKFENGDFEMGGVDEGRVCRSSKNLIKLLSPLVTSLIIICYGLTLPCNPRLCA